MSWSIAPRHSAPLAEGGGDADVRGGRDRRHRDQHADQRAGLGRGQREHPGDAGEEGDDERERVGVGDEVGERMVGGDEVLRGQVDAADREREQERGRDPDRKADRERRAASAARRRGGAGRAATQSPAIGPNSGPTIIAPTIRIGESRKIPTEAIRQASAMKSEEVRGQLGVLGGPRLDLLPDDGVARAARRRPLGGRRRRSEIAESMCSIAIEPSVSTSSSRRSETITLASSRATSQRITSPSGLRGGALEEDQVADRGRAARADRARARSDRPGRRSAGGPSRASVPGRVLTDYHLHLRPDELDATPAEYFTEENVERYLDAAERRGIDELGRLRAHPPLHRRARDLGPPVLARATRATTSPPTASSSARPRCGSGSRWTTSPGREDRIARAARRARLRLRGRLGPLPRRPRRRLTPTSTSGAATAIPTGLGALLRDDRRGGAHRPLRHPRPPGPGQGLGRRAPAAAARPALLTTSRRSRRSPRPAIAVEVSTAGWRKPVGELYPARRLRRDVRRRRRRRSRSPPTPTCPRTSAATTSARCEVMRELGRRRDRRLRARASAGWSRSDEGRDRLRQPPLRRRAPAGPRRGRDRARASASRDTPTPTCSPTR